MISFSDSSVADAFCVHEPSVQFNSVAKSCLTLCDPMACSTPGLPVHHQLLEFTQTHVLWVGDAMPSNHLILCRPLLLLPSILSSIRVFSNESGNQSIGVSTSTSVPPMNTQDWSPLGWIGWISLQYKGLLRVPWTARRSNQSLLKEIYPKYSLEGLMMKLQYFGHLMWRADSLEKTLMLGKIEGGRRKR